MGVACFSSAEDKVELKSLAVEIPINGYVLAFSHNPVSFRPLQGSWSTPRRWLNLQEYQSKKLMQESGVAVQRFYVANTPSDALEAAKKLSEYGDTCTLHRGMRFTSVHQKEEEMDHRGIGRTDSLSTSLSQKRVFIGVHVAIS